jgi:hypothetical protein
VGAMEDHRVFLSLLINMREREARAATGHD